MALAIASYWHQYRCLCLSIRVDVELQLQDQDAHFSCQIGIPSPTPDKYSGSPRSVDLVEGEACCAQLWTGSLTLRHLWVSPRSLTLASTYLVLWPIRAPPGRSPSTNQRRDDIATYLCAFVDWLCCLFILVLFFSVDIVHLPSLLTDGHAHVISYKMF